VLARVKDWGYDYYIAATNKQPGANMTTYIHKGFEANSSTDRVTNINGETVAYIVHDKFCGLWYVGKDLESVNDFAGCGDTLEEALKDWILDMELGKA
jgi:hypothetical protein